MIMTESTLNEIFKQIAFILRRDCLYYRNNICIVDKQEINLKNYNPKRLTMTTQIKKVGKNTYPNRVNRSTHYIGQPRSTGCNH